MPGTPFLRLTAALALALAPAAAFAAAPSTEVRYTVLLAGNRSGSAVTTSVSDHEWRYTYEFNDRGRGPKTASHAIADPQGVPALFEITGIDYYKNPIDERFERKGATASWRNTSEKGERTVNGPAYFRTLNGPPQEN